MIAVIHRLVSVVPPRKRGVRNEIIIAKIFDSFAIISITKRNITCIHLKNKEKNRVVAKKKFQTDGKTAISIGDRMWGFAVGLNWLVERICVVLVAVLVLDIWFGIVARYFLELGITWTEELARYIMIWAALLAISSAAHRREHIGLVFVLTALPPRPRRVLQAAIDCLGIAFFLFLLVYGIRMTIDGASQFAMIFGMTMVVPFAAVPVSAGLTALQIFMVAIRPPTTPETPEVMIA